MVSKKLVVESKNLEVGTKVIKSNGVILTVKRISHGMAVLERSFRNGVTSIYEQIPTVHIKKCKLYTII